jgi:hypothetical protein
VADHTSCQIHEAQVPDASEAGGDEQSEEWSGSLLQSARQPPRRQERDDDGRAEEYQSDDCDSGTWLALTTSVGLWLVG